MAESSMEIQVAVPVEYVFPTSTHELEKRQEELTVAEDALQRLLLAANDFFANATERDAVIHRIQQHPTEMYEKPFMNKIAKGFLDVQQCQAAVEKASESIMDANVPPVVKAHLQQIKHHHQQAYAQLKQELEVERQHRLAFQSKVKEFSEEVYLHLLASSKLIPVQKCFHDVNNFLQTRHACLLKTFDITTADMCSSVYASPFYKKYGIGDGTRHAILSSPANAPIYDYPIASYTKF